MMTFIEAVVTFLFIAGASLSAGGLFLLLTALFREMTKNSDKGA